MAVGRAADILTRNHPVGELNPIKVAEGMVLIQKRTHLSPPMRLQHFYSRLLSPGVGPIPGLIAVNPLAAQPPGSPLPPMGGRSRLAGEFPRGGGNPLEFAGTAVFRGDRLAGLLTVDETAAVLALRGEMGKMFASVPDPREPGQWVAFRVHQANKPQYRAGFAGDRPAVRVKLQFEGEILSAPGGTDYAQPRNRRDLERFAAHHLRTEVYGPLLDRLYREWGADPVGLGNLFRTRFPTAGAWLNCRWADHVRDVQVTVDIELFIRRFGLLLHGRVEGEGG